MQRIFHQYFDLPTWNLTRVLGVLFGLTATGFGLANGDGLTGIFGLVILMQAILNIGCIGNACAVPPARRSSAISPPDDEG
jgi:hypothetical protein